MNVKPKDDDDQTMGRQDTMENKEERKSLKGLIPRRQMINANIDWNLYVKNFENTEKEKLIDSISKILLQTKSGVDNDLIKKYTDASGRESFIKTATLQIMSTPEYQLC